MYGRGDGVSYNIDPDCSWETDSYTQIDTQKWFDNNRNVGT